MSGDVYDRFDRYDDKCPCINAHEPCYLYGFHCSISHILDRASGIVEKARIGSWADLDGLEVGNGGMSYEEYKLQFSLWALTKSSFLLGNDVTDMSKETMAIIANKHVIALNQDKNSRAGYRIWKQQRTDGSIQLWGNRLGDG